MLLSRRSYFQEEGGGVGGGGGGYFQNYTVFLLPLDMTIFLALGTEKVMRLIPA